MSLLLTGILIWTLVHFLPVFAQSLRKGIINTVGLMTYKGIFSLAIVSSMALMVMGWQQHPEEYYYPQMAGAREATMALVFLAIILLVSAKFKSNIKRYVRNPQLSGITIWSLAHLLSNGEARAVLLFSGFFIWAYIMRIGINIRDGEWQKPEKVSFIHDIKVLGVASVIYGILLYTHINFTGASLT